MTFFTATKSLCLTMTLFFLTLPNFAADAAHSMPAVQGYDLVSYHQQGKPLAGTGMHTSVYEGETYLFISKENKAAFDKNPARYLPAYGGYCAYGVAVGKKFVGDPTVWEVVDGVLYLNLNKDIQTTWAKDTKHHIKKANQAWPTIKNKAASEL